MKTAQQMWMEHRNTLPRHMSLAEVKATRKGFLAGAMAMMYDQIDMLERENSSQVQTWVNEIQGELEEMLNAENIRPQNVVPLHPKKN